MSTRFQTNLDKFLEKCSTILLRKCSCQIILGVIIADVRFCHVDVYETGFSHEI